MSQSRKKTTKNYKPLIYILPNQTSSFEEVMASTAEVIDHVEDNQSDLKSKLYTAGKIALLALSMPFSTFEIAEVLMGKPKKSPDESIEKPENKSEINNLLNQLDLGDWSDFITQIPYLEIPNVFDFPPGHPLPGKLYRVHPLKSKKNKYIPIEVFDSLLYAEREAELIRLLTDLGATQITIRQKQTGQTDTELSARVEIIGAGGLEGGLEAEISKSDESVRSLSLGGNPWKPELVEKFNQADYSWLTYEPAWAAIVHSRLHGKCLTASIELTNDDSYSISGKIGLAEGLLKNLAGLEAGGSFSRNQNKTSLVFVEFAPPIDDDSSRT